MSLKSRIKHAVVGPPGERPHRVRHGLLKGATFKIDTASRSQRVLGLDELEIAKWMRRLSARARAAVDVGAHDGWYSTYYALQPNIERVYAFEPDTRLHDEWRENLAFNGPALINKCVFSSKFVGPRDDDTSIRLDSVLTSETRPLIIKIDVEGAELTVLHGAEQTLRRLECHLVIETHTADMEIQCQSFLKTLGYHTRIIKNAWYRAIVPESRPLAHNRWLVASKTAL